MVDRDTFDHLRGIVALWLTNGNNPVEGGNDTRYDFFRGGWSDAAFATEELVSLGLCKWAVDRNADEDYHDLHVIPTAKGIGECLR